MKTPDKLSTRLEPERYELSAQPTYHFGLPRRDFFKVLGGGIVVFCLLDGPLAGQEAGRARRASGESLPQDIAAWLHVNENGEVTVCTGKVEVGQNIRTSLTQAVAEELSDCAQLDPPAHGRHRPRAL